ncbi:DMT family transporter [Sporolactobacillus putidus]|uniref:Transporter n=1 Tax=Sporolactobacillus putidus TaxID=492735 RepID=A0A917S148_9BACL|nr:DMT family transporter [Sporolactobacillus putidus]GGL50102.1 transporter [Sporolactobacillus putidus]
MTKPMANGLLLLTSVLWGSGFVAIKIALDANVSSGFINFFRGILFAALAFILFHKNILKMTHKEFKVGLIAGLLNFGGFITQTIGILYTTPSNNAFISSTYVVMIPIIAWIVFQKKIPIKSIISIILCLLGMTILTGVLNKAFTFNTGDIYSLICALFYAGSIVYLGYGARIADVSVVAFMLAVIQAAGGFIFFLWDGAGQLAAVNWSAALVPLLYVGIICSFVGQTIQILAQKHTSATSAGLIMMLEGVFGSIFSIAFGYDRLTVNLFLGGTVITFSLILMEVDLQHLLDRFRRHLHSKSSM